MSLLWRPSPDRSATASSSASCVRPRTRRSSITGSPVHKRAGWRKNDSPSPCGRGPLDSSDSPTHPSLLSCASRTNALRLDRRRGQRKAVALRSPRQCLADLQIIQLGDTPAALADQELRRMCLDVLPIATVAAADESRKL